MLTLRPYQNQIINGVRQAYLAGFRAPLAVAPTGAGKTVIFTHIAMNTNLKGKRVLILVHRVELLRQTSQKLHEFGVVHGLINPKYAPNYFSTVQVASVQTIVNRLGKIHPPDLIVIDEAHHATAGTWRKILDAYPRARVLGVTATPCRGDGSGLGIEQGGVFDHLVLGPQIGELIAGGYLVAPKVYAPLNRLDLSKVDINKGDFDKKQIQEIVDKPLITGNAIEHYRRFCDGAPAVAFCINIRHAEHVAAEFRAAGYRAQAVDGEMEDDTRKRILGGLSTGAVQIVCSCDLISEGTDIPAIGCAILLRPTKSLGLYIQQVGRALRTSAGKERAIILDHVGNVLMHGMPDDPRDWTLEGEKKRRKKGDAEQTIKVHQCPQCFMVFDPQPLCPGCGFVKEVQEKTIGQESGELQEFTPEIANRIRKKVDIEVAQARTKEDLERIARERGYKPGWVKHKLEARARNANR